MQSPVGLARSSDRNAQGRARAGLEGLEQEDDLQEMAGEWIQLAIGTWMLLLGVGYIRLAPNRNFKYLDPSSPEFRRLAFVGGICLWIVSFARLLGYY